MQPTITAVLEQHLEEAGFLFANFLNELSEEQPDRHYLSTVSARLEAHLDGLIISHDAVWPLCEALIDEADPEALFVAAYMAFHSGDLERIKPVVEAGSESEQGVLAVSYGLAWHPWDVSGFWAEKFAQAQRNAIKSIGLFCYATYQQTPPISTSNVLQESLLNQEEQVASALLQSALKSQDVAVINVLKADLSETPPQFQYQAIQTRFILGDTQSIFELKPLIIGGIGHEDVEYRRVAEQATTLAFRQLEIEDAKLWMAELKAQPGSERLMIVAIGAMNEQHLIPWVIQQMQTPELARIAGKVYGQLRGIDIAEQGLILEDDSLDEQWLELEGDEALEWPDQAKIAALHG